MEAKTIIEFKGAVLTEEAMHEIKNWQEHDNDLLNLYIDNLQRASLRYMTKINIKDNDAIEDIEHVQNLSFIAESLRKYKKP